MKTERFLKVGETAIIDLENVQSVVLSGSKLSFYEYESKGEFASYVIFEDAQIARQWLNKVHDVINEYHSEPTSKWDWSVIIPLTLGMLIGDLIYELIKHLF